MHEHWTEFFTSGASLLIVGTATTKTMVPLRTLAIIANCFLFSVFFVAHSWVPMAMQALALGMNGFRLFQMILLIRNVGDAVRGKHTLNWLKPFMVERRFKKGDILFAKGEPATEMFCTVTGRYQLVELGIEVQPGQVMGELAMLAPDNRRTATLECIEDGNVLSITYEEVEQLYYQNPTFGFYFLRLSTERLFDNINRLEAELAQRPAAEARGA